MLNSIVARARQDDGEKVGFSMQIPKALKEKFEAYCKKNKATMTGLLQAFMQFSVNVDEGLEKDDSNMPTDIKATLVSLLNKNIHEIDMVLEEMNASKDGNTDYFNSLCQTHQGYVKAQKYILGGS